MNAPTNERSSPTLTETVRQRYGNAALRVVDGRESAASCCGPVNSCCGGDAFAGTVDPITSNLYATGQTDELPAAAVLASRGCGNPTALKGQIEAIPLPNASVDVIISNCVVNRSGDKAQVVVDVLHLEAMDAAA